MKVVPADAAVIASVSVVLVSVALLAGSADRAATTERVTELLDSLDRLAADGDLRRSAAARIGVPRPVSARGKGHTGKRD